MSTKMICDPCGQEISQAPGKLRYKLAVSHDGGILSKDCGCLDVHEVCMQRLDKIMEHCRNGKIASLDEVLQSLET